MLAVPFLLHDNVIGDAGAIAAINNYLLFLLLLLLLLLLQLLLLLHVQVALVCFDANKHVGLGPDAPDSHKFLAFIIGACP